MGTESSLTVTRVINADPSVLWKALTDATVMEQWFFATGPAGSATVKNEPEEGGRFKIDMHGEEATYEHEGEYREVVPEKKLVFTWNSQAVSDTLVTITLSEVEGGTEIKLVHEFMPEGEVRDNHRSGWMAILENLESVTVGSVS